MASENDAITGTIALTEIIREETRLLADVPYSSPTNPAKADETDDANEESEAPAARSAHPATRSAHSLLFAQRREVRSITSVPFSFGAMFLSPEKLKEKIAGIAPFFRRLTRRSIFLAIIPLYWVVVFTQLLNYFDISLFMFVVGLSYVLSTLFSEHWGLLEWGMKS